jgi:hypothetical protein
MIIPTPEYDPMFAEDGIPFQTKMIHYIRREFSDLLGASVTQLPNDKDLEQLSRSINEFPIRRPRQSNAA